MSTRQLIPRAILIIPIFLNISLFAAAPSVDENAMFADTSSVTSGKDIVDNKTISEKDQKSVGLSGQITDANIVNFNRDWFNNFHRDNLQLSTFVLGNLLLDIRLPQGAKAFANLQTEYIPLDSAVLVSLQEIFVDGNIKDKVFLRLGKQVLQWGRCDFWNPTDLINVEKKLFIQKIGYREGAYGVKLHIPFGTAYNIYGFLDTREASSVDSIAAAGKFEFLIGGTEMAFSMWDKKNCHPVFGYDFSTRLIGLDLTGELSVSDGSNSFSLRVQNDSLEEIKSNNWQTRMCIDVGRQFNFFDIGQGLSVTGSFYYDRGGYSENIFADNKVYKFNGPTLSMDPTMPIQNIGLTKAAFLIANNLYQMNDFSQYYVGLDVEISRLFLSSLSGYFKVIDNLQQSGAVLTTGVNYVSLNEFFVGLTINGYLGQKNTEYTFQNQGMTLQITAGVNF
jgi:hypothetical protein